MRVERDAISDAKPNLKKGRTRKNEVEEVDAA
jgi:hypothetical protein